MRLGTLMTLGALIISLSAFSNPNTIYLSQVLDLQDGNPESGGNGVAVSPAHIHWSVAPGDSKTSTVTINNDTDKENKFKVSFNDFNMNGYGKSEFLEPGAGEYSLSRWVSASPSFVTLKPGEETEITLNVNIPLDHEDSNKAAWTILLIEQAEERQTLDPGAAPDKISLGVIPTFAFGVFLYQNPPGVVMNDVDIIDLKMDERDTGEALRIDVENLGDGISYCTVYVDLTNLDTGDTRKLVKKRFTIVPGLKRAFNFDLPQELPTGNYSAVTVLDFGSEDELEAAELEFRL